MTIHAQDRHGMLAELTAGKWILIISHGQFAAHRPIGWYGPNPGEHPTHEEGVPPFGDTPFSPAEDRGFEPRKGLLPNRISSAAP